MRARISSSLTTISGVQTRSSSSGMNSIKRTTTRSSRANISKRNDLIFIEAAQQHAIDFHRIEPRPPRRAHSRQHALVSIRHARDARKSLRIHRVHADRNAVKPSVFQRLCDLGQKMAVRRQRNFRLLAAVRRSAALPGRGQTPQSPCAAAVRRPSGESS